MANDRKPQRRWRRMLKAPSLGLAEQQIQVHQVRLIWLFQAIVLAGAIAICWRVGTSWWFLGAAAGTFLVLCVAIGWRMDRYARSPQPLPRRSVVLMLMQAGVWATSLSFWLLAVAVYQRTNFSVGLPDVLFPLGVAAALVIVGIATFIASRYSIRHGTTPWFQFTMGVTLLPFLAAWGSASLVGAFLTPLLGAMATDGGDDAARAGELAKRAQWAANRGWQTPDGRPLTIGVALSGGGYRAATFHAGVLKALDARCVPIRYVTTVSGGSIIGTHYALGNPPEAFKKRLEAGKPGLADSLLTLWWVAADLWWPGWNSADTYSRHFRKVFFGERTLADTALTPQLIINATDIERKALQSRDVFYKDREPRLASLNRLRVADFVAASGAFPGPFQPKQIEWPHPPHVQPEGRPPPDCETNFASSECFARRQFSDGGIHENLGYTGLALFLVLERPRAYKREAEPPPVPDLLILSDASAASEEVDLPAKVDVLTLLARGIDVSYQIQHDLLRTVISKTQPTGLTMRTEWIRAQYEEALPALDGTTYTASLSGRDVAADVNRYGTLEEFEPEQVRRAFWLGETLAEKRWPAIDAWRQENAKDGAPCAPPPK